MKTKDAYEECDKFAIQIETFFEGIPPKCKQDIGIILCQTIATCSTYKNSTNVFASLSILDMAQKELQSTLVDIVDEQIGNELINYVKKHPKETNKK